MELERACGKNVHLTFILAFIFHSYSSKSQPEIVKHFRDRNVHPPQPFKRRGAQSWEDMMLIHDQTASHQLCWNGPVAIRLAKNAPTTVSNPLVALDILKNHWAEKDKTADYHAAMDACLLATQGRCSLDEAREAFILATKHLTPGQSAEAEPRHDNQGCLPSSRSPSEHVAQAQHHGSQRS